MILSMLEHSNLYDALDVQHSMFVDAVNDPVRLALLQTPLPVFMCSPDPGGGLNRNRVFLQKDTGGLCVGMILPQDTIVHKIQLHGEQREPCQ